MSKVCRALCEFEGQTTSLLTWTEDMAAWSFSLPAGHACPMMRADDESYICHGCYAQINRYNMPNVLDAQWIRYMWTKKCMENHAGRSEWCETMIETIRKYATNGFFRVHDSGDFFHPNYARSWYYVCQALPEIKFWFPTRCWPHEGKMSKRWIDSLTRLASLPNVTVRPSALKWDEAPPQVGFLSTGTTAVTSPMIGNEVGCSVCPKTLHKGTCESNQCRTCWFNGVGVAYLVHGYRGRRSIPTVSVKIKERRQTYADKYTNLTVKGK
jgi:hypothetical protein